MFVSPFTVSLGCDAAILVIYLQQADSFGGTPWFAILDGLDFSSEMVDVVRGIPTFEHCCSFPFLPDSFP